MAYNQYDLANTSLVKTGILTEMYIPLWWYSSSYASTTNVYGSFSLQKGSTIPSGMTGSANKLHTLNTNWSSNTKFSLEVSTYTASGYTTTIALWDITANAEVTGSKINSTATTATLFRSGQFTLTPGHSYGVCIGSNSTSASALISKASLIAFLQ